MRVPGLELREVLAVHEEAVGAEWEAVPDALELLVAELALEARSEHAPEVARRQQTRAATVQVPVHEFEIVSFDVMSELFNQLFLLRNIWLLICCRCSKLNYTMLAKASVRLVYY